MLEKKVTASGVADNLERVRTNKPLIHNITNFVAMNFTANCLLALGASPIMAHAEEEIEEIVSACGAVVINIGTLYPLWTSSMLKAAGTAASMGKPFIMDPVGAGASRYRTETALKIAGVGPSLIRGNASEITALAGGDSGTKGVDSGLSSRNALAAAEKLAREKGCAVVISGETDFTVSPRGESAALRNGVPVMAGVTGMGCAASALCGAFLAVCPDPADAGISAMAVMGIAGETAREKAGSSPGTFAAAFLDSLAEMNAETIEKKLRAGDEKI